MFTVTDTSLSTRFPIYTRANVGEVFPDPVAPATRSLLLFESELGWRDAYIRMGAFETNEFPDDEFCILGVAGGYCYLNASVMRVFGEARPGLSWKAIDEQFFGAQPGIPDYVEQPGDIRPDLTEQLEQTFGWVFSITDVDQLDRLNDHKARTIDLRASRPDFSSMSDLELWEYAEALFPFHRELFQEHIYVTTLTTVPVGVIQTVATAVGRPDLIMPLIAGVGQVDSAEPSYAMWELSRLDPTSDEFASGFEQFRLDFGSRGPNEWEARSPTWDTHPNIALAAIDRMRLAGEEADPRAHQQQRASERAEAAETLLSIVEADSATHGQLAAAIVASGAWLPARERTKTNNIRLIQEVRVPLRELGRRFVERQVFDEIEDFGLVLNEEMEEVFGPTPEGLTERVRSVARPTHSWLSANQNLSSLTHPATHRHGRSADDVEVEPLAAGDSVQGLPGCPGVSEGVARRARLKRPNCTRARRCSCCAEY